MQLATVSTFHSTVGSSGRYVEFIMSILDASTPNTLQAFQNSPRRSDALPSKLPVFIARANYPFGYSTKWTHGNLTEERAKRGVPALYSMIKCATNCNPAILQGHGCFCGFLGNGLPVDGVDRCCRNHDKCYGQSKCIKYIEYFVPYLWKCYSGKPLCANHHGIWGDEQSCAAKLCECDLKLSYCLRKQICPRRRASCSSSRARRIQNFLFVK